MAKTSYTITWTRPATKGLRKLDQQAARRVRSAVDALATDPRPSQARPLKGNYAGLWRLKVGDHLRVVYRIEDQIRVVEVIEVGQREGIY